MYGDSDDYGVNVGDDNVDNDDHDDKMMMTVRW